MLTHVVAWDEPGRVKAKALCGLFVDRTRDHSHEPTCPDCRRLQADRDKFSMTDSTEESGADS